MVTFFVILQVIVAIFLIIVVLLQPGNRGGVSAALGGAGGDTVFGGRGANTFLAKLTFGAATIFMLSNLALSFMSSDVGSVLDRVKLEQPAAAPAKPADAKPAEPAAAANSEAKPELKKEMAPAESVKPADKPLPKENK